ncbi:MAG: EAL domain-containing protein [Pseudomonadales bacterium]|nr:EAL domain-containing protein [Pseudomonadales bacterium]
MSAQPSQHVTTRLLIAEKSENAAHTLDSTLRDAGVATKLSISDDLAHIAQLIASDEIDIALLTDKLPGLENILPRIKENAPHVPLLLLTNPESDQDWSPSDALRLGVTDIVPADQHEYISLVVQRELEHICSRQHTSQLRRALTEAEQRCQLLLQGSQAAIAYVHEGMHIHANEGYLSLFGYTDLDDLCGASLVDLLSTGCADELKQALKELRNGADDISLDFVSANDERSGSMALTHSQYEGEDCLQVTARTDTTQSKLATQANPTQEQELGLPGFVRSAETLFASSHDQCYLMCVALDNYSATQQAYGLLGAESISRKVWIQLSESAAEFPTVRLSTHQFALAVTAATWDQANELAENLRAEVEDQIFEVQDRTVRPTISITGTRFNPELGIGSCLDESYASFLELMEEEQSNVVRITDPDAELEDDASDDARIVLRQITHAIENKMFVLLYQPIISLRGDSDEHYEVFLRMVDDSGSQIEPGRFLQTAIDNNVAGKIDRWVILQSIKMLSVHRARGNATRLTINLTSNTVLDKEFPQWLGVAMKAARLPADAVIFQITEKDAIGYLRQTREFVERLRSMHCRCALSRFGLIEDPFETLRHIPVDVVKLDGSFIEKVETDEAERESMISSIQKLQSMGKLTVVPMVENANVLSTLWQAGANYIQGHYLQEPSVSMDYDFTTEE